MAWFVAEEELNYTELTRKYGLGWEATHGIEITASGYECGKCWGAKLPDLGRVREHIETKKHQNKISSDAYQLDPLRDVPLSDRPFVHIEAGFAKCVLCDKYWDESHADSSKHRTRAAYPLAYGWRPAAPPEPPHAPPVVTTEQQPSVHPVSHPSDNVSATGMCKSSDTNNSGITTTASAASNSGLPVVPPQPVEHLFTAMPRQTQTAMTPPSPTAVPHPWFLVSPPPTGQTQAAASHEMHVAASAPASVTPRAGEVSRGQHLARHSYDGALEPDGYLTFEAGDLVWVLYGAPTPGSAENKYSSYIYGQTVNNGMFKKGWFPSEVAGSNDPDVFWV